MSEWICGKHPVLHLIKSGRRKALKLYLQKGFEKNEKELMEEIHRKKVPFALQDPKFFSSKFPGSNHQGVAVEAAPYPYVPFEDQLSKNWVLLLDEVQDPQNLGALCRSAYLFGVEGVVIPETHAASVTSGACHASVGAVEYLAISRISSLASALERFKENGFWVYGADHEAEKNIDQEAYPAKVALVIGNEEKGLRRLVKERCDILIKIPTVSTAVDSLNASVSGGVILYEMARQKRGR